MQFLIFVLYLGNRNAGTKIYGAKLGAKIYGAELGARISDAELPIMSSPCLRRAQELGASNDSAEDRDV